MHIEIFELLEEVSFYTIRQDEATDSETDLFIGRFIEKTVPDYEAGYEEEMADILNWIEQIGLRGLHICQLRHENEASALPPNRSYVGDIAMIGENRLRLYCVQLSPQIVILCGGGIKTGQTVQESPHLLSAFRLANKIARETTTKITQREIQIDGRELSGDLEIWL